MPGAGLALVFPEPVAGLAEPVCGPGEPVAVPLDDSGGVGEVLSPGENEDDPVETGPDLPVQAETDAEASMVMVPQPMMVSIALSPVPAILVRTFMEPPHASRQVADQFSGYSTRNRHRKGARVTTGRWPKAGPRKPAATRVKPMDGGHTMK